ncbi:MAG TPA: hypothetical protein VKT52_13165 [Ktedonobacterales bacterium]|nr:hypothetical protein [Ktedonobacterales bacterium]
MERGQESEPQRAHPRYDQLLKWMLTRAHDGFLALVAPGLVWRGERSPEVPAVARYADLVWEIERHDGRRGLLHIELQLKVEDDIGERLAEYAIRLYRRDHLPVRSVVVFLRKATVPTSPFVIPWEEHDDSLRCTFIVVRLWEVPQEKVLATDDYDLWPLAALMAGATVETTVALAERLATIPAPQQERSDLIGLLVGLSGVNIARDILLSMLRRNPVIDEILKESSIAEVFREEGMRRTVHIVLEGRFGPLADDLLAAINGADEAALEQVAAHAATDTLEQIRERLGLR